MSMSVEAPEFDTCGVITPAAVSDPSACPSREYFNLMSCIICVFTKTELPSLKCNKLCCLELYWNTSCV